MLRKNAESSTNSNVRVSASGPHLLAAEPVLEGERQEMTDIDDLGRLALDHRRAEHARHVAADLDVEPLLDDVDDLVDDEAHRASGIGEHEQRLGRPRF